MFLANMKPLRGFQCQNYSVVAMSPCWVNAYWLKSEEACLWPKPLRLKYQVDLRSEELYLAISFFEAV